MPRRPSKCKLHVLLRSACRVVLYVLTSRENLSDPENPKGYIRKATVLFGMKEYDKAISVIEQASEKDKDKKASAEIQRETKKILNAKFAERSTETDEQTLQRAMRDPEVQSILSDPVMMRE